MVDLRNRVAFAEGHVAGSFNFEVEGQLATYLAWMIPWGKPVSLLAESTEDIARAQRELARVGIDRPAAAAVGSPADWTSAQAPPASFARAAFADLAAARERGETPVVLDVRRDGERAGGWIEGSVTSPSTRSTSVFGRCPRARCGCTARAGCARRSPRPCSTPSAVRWWPSTTATPLPPTPASRS